MTNSLSHLMKRSLRPLALAVVISGPLALCAGSRYEVQAGAAADLQKATAELTAARQQVESERLPLARKITELEQLLITRRADFAKAQRFQENQLVELNALKTDAKRQA